MMKGKCSSLWISIVITIVILFLAVIFQFVRFPNELYQVQNFCIVMLLGAVSGALVALIIFIDAYRNEKRNTLEKYLVAAVETLSHFRNLKYFLVREPVGLLTRYFEEQEHNSLAQYLCDQLRKSGDTKVYTDSVHTLRYDVRDEWCRLLEPGYFLLKEKMESEKYQKMLEDEVARRVDDYIGQINNVVDSYVALWDEVSFSELDRLYGQIGFFTGRKPRDRIYRAIQQPLHAKLQNIQSAINGRFGMYKSGEDASHAHVLSILTEVQSENFTAEIHEDKSGKATIVYNDFYTHMAKCLEDFRSKLHDVEPQYPGRFCVRSALNL